MGLEFEFTVHYTCAFAVKMSRWFLMYNSLLLLLVTSTRCPRRRAQQGLSVRVHVVRRLDGNWELRAAQSIPPRSFVGCFAGEVSSNRE